jgi:hypothetical protein
MIRNILLKTGAVALAALILVISFGGETTPAEAQDPTCWLPVYETVTVIEFGFPVEKREKVDEVFDPRCRFEDGRINRIDAAAPVTIYCLPDGGVSVWDVNLMSDGELAYSVTVAEIAAVPTLPAENTLIHEQGGIRLYRLTSGELQVNAPPNYSTEPEYVFIWQGCPL